MGFFAVFRYLIWFGKWCASSSAGSLMYKCQYAQHVRAACIRDTTVGVWKRKPPFSLPTPPFPQINSSVKNIKMQTLKGGGKLSFLVACGDEIFRADFFSPILPQFVFHLNICGCDIPESVVDKHRNMNVEWMTLQSFCITTHQHQCSDRREKKRNTNE